MQGPQTLLGEGYTLSKHRHHVTQRTHSFCANSALGCRQYRPHGSGLSNQSEKMVGEEGKGPERTQSQGKCLSFLIPGLPFLLSVPLKWPLASPSFQAGTLDRALVAGEGRQPSLSHASQHTCCQVVSLLAD